MIKKKKNFQESFIMAFICPWELKVPEANQHQTCMDIPAIAGLSSGHDNKSEPFSAIMCPIDPNPERCHINYWLTSLFMRKTDRLSRWCIR